MNEDRPTATEVLALMDAARADGSAASCTGPSVTVAPWPPMPGYDPDPYAYIDRLYLGPTVTATTHDPALGGDR